MKVFEIPSISDFNIQIGCEVVLKTNQADSG